MKYILILLMCIPGLSQSEECTTNKHVINNLERRFVKKIIKVWHKEGTHAELDKLELEKKAKKLSRQVIKDNYVCVVKK